MCFYYFLSKNKQTNVTPDKQPRKNPFFEDRRCCVADRMRWSITTEPSVDLIFDDIVGAEVVANNTSKFLDC